MYSKTVMVGRVVEDIKPIETKTGNKFIKNSIAVSRDRKDSEGRSITDFWDFTVGGSLVPVMENYVKKGNLVLLEGRMERKFFEKEGVKRESIQLRVEHIQLLSNPKQVEPFDNSIGVDLPWEQ